MRTSADSSATATMKVVRDTVFTCPMHPEVRQSGPGECPKCGMDLEPMQPGTSRAFKMQFQTEPQMGTAGQPMRLRLQPQDPKDAGTEVALDVVHEKKIHLIVVSEDLTYFDHIHPEYGEAGYYMVTHTFPKNGRYVLFADYKAAEGQHQTDTHSVQVGLKMPKAEPAFSSQRLKTVVDGFAVTIIPTVPDGPQTNTPIKMAIMLEKDGQTVSADALENYLGAKAHVVMIEQKSLAYTHIHPEAEDGKLSMQTTFEKSGIYRVWLQFQTEGKVHTADFVLVIN